MIADTVRVCRRYLDTLPLPPHSKSALLEFAQKEAEPDRAFAKLHAALAGASWIGTHAAFTSVQRRLKLALPPRNGTPDGPPSVPVAPPVQRTPMAPTEWPPPSTIDPGKGGVDDRKVTRTARVRRTVFSVLALTQTATFAYYMVTKVLPYHGREPMELAILTLSTLLFLWVSLGFWTALSGFLLLCFGRDRYAITRSAAPGAAISPEARTAIIMPICNEHVARVFAGLRATYESLAATGASAHFDVFVLSDSSEPDTLTAERQAWFDLCTAVGGFGNIFYRWRRHRIKRKSGNVADFCRRWGRRYRYMVVLDADSVMSGTCLTTLVRLMEANPSTGIIQTAPRAAGRETLYARVQQFAMRVYGPVFTAGLHFWQLGESYYWGHNAIIRVAPFMRHCALGRLPGRGPLSGEILSHDFVEAALMRRAGWKVWMAYDLPGSYEEMPPNLLDELKRDQRWCRGNLINARMFLWQGLHPAHRAVFMTGVMTYVSAPLWLLSVALSTVFVVLQTVIGPQYFVESRQLFPMWPEWDVDAAIGIGVGTAVLLFVPKILGAGLALWRNADEFGGALRLTLSLLGEILLSALLAPIRMLFHTQFVIAALTSLTNHWKSPPREDAETTWGEAIRRHGAHMLLAAAWAAGAYSLTPDHAWWLMPVVGALALSAPLSVYTSRVSIGRALGRAKLLVIPEEMDLPKELRLKREYLDRAGEGGSFVDAVVDPLTNAIVCAATSPHSRRGRSAQSRRDRAIAAAVERGPGALTVPQKVFFLTDAVALSYLHFHVWTSETAHPSWFGAGVFAAVRGQAALPQAS